MKIYETRDKAPVRQPIKVFGIGLGRTGTHTLSWMLSRLGWRTAHGLPEPEDYERFDAVTDTPTYLYLSTIDIRFPSCKFVLTARPLSDWLCSIKARFDAMRDTARNNRLKCYSCVAYDEQRLKQIHERHNSFVAWYRDRYIAPERFLTIDLCDRSIPDFEKWRLLCRFLGVAVPNLKLPVLNASSEYKMRP